VACTDLLSGQLVTLTSGPISLAVRASCALPGIFAPVPLGGRPLIDGGFLEPVPFRALGAAPGALRLGVQAGVDVRRSLIVRFIRRFNASSAGRALDRYAEAATGSGTTTQMVRGVALALGSYSRQHAAPTGSALLRVDPGIAWWDFHRSPQAIQAGQQAMLDLLRAGAVRFQA
jgi:NTE family protein